MVQFYYSRYEEVVEEHHLRLMNIVSEAHERQTQHVLIMFSLNKVPKTLFLFIELLNFITTKSSICLASHVLH